MTVDFSLFYFYYRSVFPRVVHIPLMFHNMISDGTQADLFFTVVMMDFKVIGKIYLACQAHDFMNIAII